MAKGTRRANGHGAPGHNSGKLWLSRVYNVQDRDPEIERFEKMVKQEHIKDSDLAVLAGLASATVHKMFDGTTRMPRHSTFAKIAGAIGYKYDLVREQEPDYQHEIPKARQQFKDYRALLAKRRQQGESKR